MCSGHHVEWLFTMLYIYTLLVPIISMISGMVLYRVLQTFLCDPIVQVYEYILCWKQLN